MRLVIAEKPSVSQALSKVLGADMRRDGYMEGNGYLVSWCYGHLAGLSDAESYDSRYKKWRKEDLPILPSPFRFCVSGDKKKQFSLLRELMHRPDVTEIINACDAGREGELIFRTVYDLAGCSKPMKRLWISSMEDDAIREGFANLYTGREYDGLHQSALCRAKADWLVGINATRFFSLVYDTKLNVGRVMSPTLALLVQRESEIAAFVPETYYTVNLDFPEFSAVSEKLTKKEDAAFLESICQKKEAVVSNIQHWNKSEKAPALYDLTTLQRDANRLLGYTAQQTLDYLQALYEKKLCTYPRTDSRYLTDDMESSVQSIALCAAGIYGVSAPGEILAKRVCNSMKVSDHHAILPTLHAGEQPIASLPTGEREILKLISRQVLMAVSKDYRYKEAEVTISCGGTSFKSIMKTLWEIGWKKYLQKAVQQKWFSGLDVGQVLNPSKVSIQDGKTQPPHHFTEDTLLAAMESAGAKDMPDENRVPTKLKDFVGEGGATEWSGCSPSGGRSEAEFATTQRKGLGTPATRAGILEKLASTGMVERKKAKKQVNLVPTALGNSLITVLPEQLQSPFLTAEWEQKLSRIQRGELESEDFLNEISKMLSELIEHYHPVSGADILIPSKEKTIGSCPRCGKPIIERSNGFFCVNQDCTFALWKDSRFFTLKQKALDRKTAQSLLETGRAPLKGCISPRTGKSYDASVALEDDGDKVHFKLVFDNG